MVLTGSNLAEPTRLLTDFPAKITIPAEEKNGQDPAKLKVRLEVPADVPLGYYPLRLATKRGVSNLRLFCVDELPQMTVAQPNQSFESAQQVPVPCVVSGQLAAEAGAYFKITASAGQRVSFEVLGRRLGSPIDPQISIYSTRSKRELAHDNDAPGCQTDPRLSYVFKEAGDYIVEVKDVLGRGGPDYAYRLRIGDFPLATVPIPMAAKRGSKAKIGFAGPLVEGVATVEVTVPADPAVEVLWVAPKGPSGLSGWPVALALTDMDESVEREPNNEPGQANRIAVPGGITGRFQRADDADFYVFAGKKGQKLMIEAQTLDLYSPTLVYMVLKNAKTKADLAKTNPQSPPPADQRLEFTPSEDGDYLLEVQHLNYSGGPSEAYHLVITPSTPGFDLTLAADRYELPVDGFVPLPLQVNRRGFTGPIEVSVHAVPVIHAGETTPRRTPLPQLAGWTTIKSGQNSGALLVTASSDAPLGAYAATILAKATVDGKTVVQPINVRGPVTAALSGLPHPPLHLNHEVAFGVREKAPFTLAVRFESPGGVPGIPAQVIISATRAPDAADEIILGAPLGLPPNVPAPKMGNIAKGKNDLKISLDLNPKTPPGEYLLLFSARTKVKDREYAAHALPLPLVVGAPFDLKVEPSQIDLKPGHKRFVTVTAARKGGYKGPIALELRKLPAKTTAAKVTLAADQATTALEITAAADAPPADKNDVDVTGAATALNNLQNASAAFTVRVRKDEP
jgi:hypothetical protein